MASCPKCQSEYTPPQNYCTVCGGDIDQTPTARMEVPVGTGQSTVSSGGARGGLSIDETTYQAEKIEIVQRDAGTDFCAYGGERVVEERSFKCPNCGKHPFCVHHYNQSRRLCAECLDQQTVACAICNARVPSGETFECDRCHRVVGRDHLDASHNWCSECNAKYTQFIDSLGKDEVVITAEGTAVGEDTVDLVDGVLKTKDGKPVATIKENIWYVPSKQWHRVKPQILRREQQAMRRFYPSMRMGASREGDVLWQGPVSTWSGKGYTVQIRYPSYFPYAPPEAYVVEPKIKKSRHIYDDGHLCLFHKDDKTWQPDTTAATVMSWVSLWLHCYEAWQETGDWPRREHDQLVVAPSY